MIPSHGPDWHATHPLTYLAEGVEPARTPMTKPYARKTHPHILQGPIALQMATRRIRAMGALSAYTERKSEQRRPEGLLQICAGSSGQVQRGL